MLRVLVKFLVDEPLVVFAKRRSVGCLGDAFVLG